MKNKKGLIVFLGIFLLFFLSHYFVKETLANHLLKEISVDIDRDGQKERIQLIYTENKVILSVGNDKALILEAEDEEAILKDIPQSHYDLDLSLVNNYIVVTTTYGFVNKFGQSTEVQVFEYKNNTLKSKWRSDDFLRGEIPILEYLNSGLGKAQVENTEIDFLVSKDDLKEFTAYMSFQEENDIGRIYLEFPLVLNSILFDTNNDGIEELLTISAVRCGASSYTDHFIALYEFRDERIQFKDGWFESYDNYHKDQDYMIKLKSF